MESLSTSLRHAFIVLVLVALALRFAYELLIPIIVPLSIILLAAAALYVVLWRRR